MTLDDRSSSLARRYADAVDVGNYEEAEKLREELAGVLQGGITPFDSGDTEKPAREPVARPVSPDQVERVRVAYERNMRAIADRDLQARRDQARRTIHAPTPASRQRVNSETATPRPGSRVIVRRVWNGFLIASAILTAVAIPAVLIANSSYGVLRAVGFVALFLIVPFVFGLLGRSRSK